MKPLPVPDNEILALQPTHELLGIWARLNDEKRAKLLKYAWVLIPEKRRPEIKHLRDWRNA